MAIDLEVQLAAVIDALAADQVPYALCGGLALAVHGYPRATKDIDVLVREEDLPLIWSSVARAGFTLRAGPIPLGATLATPQHLYRVSKIVEGAACSVDLLLVSPSYRFAWESRQAIEWKGRPLHVVSRQGLMSMKRLSTRLRDRADLEILEGSEE